MHASGANHTDHRREGPGFNCIPTIAANTSKTRRSTMLVRGKGESGYYDDESWLAPPAFVCAILFIGYPCARTLMLWPARAPRLSHDT